MGGAGNEPPAEKPPNNQSPPAAKGAGGSDPTSLTCSLEGVASVVEDPEDQMGMVPFAESAWTYPVVIGLVRAGVVEAIFAVVLLLVNLFMQMAFMVIILSPDFLPGDIADQIDFAKQWRRSVGTLKKYSKSRAEVEGLGFFPL